MIKEYVEELMESISNFKSSPFTNIANILSFTVLAASVVTFINAFYMFARDGGFDGNNPFSLGTIPFYCGVCKYSFGVLLTAFILCIVGKCRGENKPIIKKMLVICIISYVILPAILLLIANIFGIFAILFFIGIGAAMFFGGTSDDTNKEVISSMETKKYQETSHSVINQRNPNATVKEFSGNCTFYRGKGSMGIMTPQGDSIYMDGNLVTHSFVCTVKDFEEGKVEIYLNGRRVTGI